MVNHVRSKWLAGAGAVLLVLAMTGLAAAATVVDDTAPATLATFEDLNGNGIDDDCETAVVANPDGVTTTVAGVDANADGVISTTEAAHSDWVGGTNCNHGGYVSTIARSTADDCDEADAPEATTEETKDESAGRLILRPSRPTAPRTPRQPMRPPPPTMPLALRARPRLPLGRRSSCP